MIYYGIYMMLALIAQNMVFTGIRPLGVCPMVLPAVAVSVGMFESPVWGGVFGLIMGVFADMSYIENTVMFTIMFPAISFGASFVSRFFINKSFMGYMGISLIASFACSVVQMLRVIATDGFAPIMLIVVVIQTVWSMLPAVLAYFPPAKWIKRYE